MMVLYVDVVISWQLPLSIHRCCSQTTNYNHVHTYRYGTEWCSGSAMSVTLLPYNMANCHGCPQSLFGWSSYSFLSLMLSPCVERATYEKKKEPFLLRKNRGRLYNAFYYKRYNSFKMSFPHQSNKYLPLTRSLLFLSNKWPFSSKNKFKEDDEDVQRNQGIWNNKGNITQKYILTDTTKISN